MKRNPRVTNRKYTRIGILSTLSVFERFHFRKYRWGVSVRVWAMQVLSLRRNRAFISNFRRLLAQNDGDVLEWQICDSFSAFMRVLSPKINRRIALQFFFKRDFSRLPRSKIDPATLKRRGSDKNFTQNRQLYTTMLILLMIISHKRKHIRKI